MKGVVAAGHPLTAETGAKVLREGGNAVDAAVAAVLASFALESPLTGFGAGGFMMVHRPGVGGGGNATELIDFFVAVPGLEGTERTEELVPVDVYFDPSTVQVFNVGPASCGVPGTAAGLADAVRRHGTVPLADLVRPAARLAREGAPVTPQQAFVLKILEPIYGSTPELREIYAPAGRMLREGEELRWPDLAGALERFGAEGPDPFYSGDIGLRVAHHVRERGGTLAPADMAAYRAEERVPVRASFAGRHVFTNPPPSSGGILIAFALELLERMGRSDLDAVIEVMRIAHDARDEDFSEGLRASGFERAFLDADRLDNLGSTTHLCAIDADGICATVTCSNGTGSGVLVPGTGVHVNNMLGEEDLNPQGFHRAPVGSRMPSMMAPTVVLHDGEVVAGLGSAGSNRIRSAILQTLLGLIAGGLSPAEAIAAPRVHYEAGILQAEPGSESVALERAEAMGMKVIRWDHLNLFFGGVQAVTRDPASGRLDGGGDPRRGGAAAVAE
ncbi:MAG TPA: gamma-glutamyltransferase [Solirubrobacterales bacterium]|nr:gamma-glutamyltransferase [Solirubrobacterales bacterium]